MNIMDRLIERELRTIDPEPGEPLRVKLVLLIIRRALERVPPRLLQKYALSPWVALVAFPQDAGITGVTFQTGRRRRRGISSKNGVRTALVGLPYRSWL